jgi:hypothetical protein
VRQRVGRDFFSARDDDLISPGAAATVETKSDGDRVCWEATMREFPEERSEPTPPLFKNPHPLSSYSQTGYYAVRRGYRPGIYRDWDSCQEQIDGFNHQEFKKFRTLREAENYLLAGSKFT